jgi:hypothetical protein
VTSTFFVTPEHFLIQLARDLEDTLFPFTMKSKEQKQVFEPTFRLAFTVSRNRALSRILLAFAQLDLVVASRSWSRRKKGTQRQSAAEGGPASPDSMCPGGQTGELPGVQDPSMEHTIRKPEGQDGKPEVPDEGMEPGPEPPGVGNMVGFKVVSLAVEGTSTSIDMRVTLPFFTAKAQV